MRVKDWITRMDSTGTIVLGIAICTFIFAVWLAIRITITAHMLGTFKFDNSGETYRCRMEFDNLDEVEKLKFAIVKIEEADLSLPGERSSQDRQPL